MEENAEIRQVEVDVTNHFLFCLPVCGVSLCHIKKKWPELLKDANGENEQLSHHTVSDRILVNVTSCRTISAHIPPPRPAMLSPLSVPILSSQPQP